MTLSAPVKISRGPRGGRPSWIFLHKRQMEVYANPARFKVVVAGRRWGKCLVEDTLIQMWDGSQKPIQHVRPGDVVATINEDTYELQPRRVQDVACNGERDLVRVKTAGREVVGTPHHPMLINNEWVKLQDAKPGDLIGVAKGDFFGSLADGGVAWERITSVEPAGRGVTYDLSIEGNHNYIANGAVSHNTQLSKVTINKYARKSGQLIWYIAPTYQMARQIMWQELQDSIPRKWISKINGSTMTIFLKNRTVISLKGADKPDTLRGVGLDYVVLDEFQDMRPETWDTVIQPTLASTRGHALFIGTPKSFNHLYDHYMTGQDPSEIDWASWQFETVTSPFILPEEIDRARRTMSEKEFNQEFCASFESMSNRVYHAFDRATHVRRCRFDPRKPIIIGMDFNIDPMSAILMQKHGPELHVFAEISLSNSNTGEMSDEIERRFWRNKGQITIYPDPAGTSRSTASSGESDFSILRGKGFSKLRYRRRHPRVRDRINAVNRMLRAADGTVRLYVDHSCKTLISSLEQTQYKKDGRDIDKSLGIEHATDALGYPIELEYPVRSLRVLGVNI